MMTFVRFHEYNDHEGEQWNTWLQRDGNVQELNKLNVMLQTLEAGVPYQLSYCLHLGDIENEEIVDKLCEYAEEGYGRTHSKVTGKFTCPTNSTGNADDLFYKGEIKAYFS